VNERLARVRQLVDWVDGQTIRERALILAVMLVGLFAGWDLWLMSPLAARGEDARNQILGLQGERHDLAEKVGHLQAAVAVDPDVENRRRHASLQAALGQVERDIEVHAGDLISPSSMRTLVERVLAHESALELVRLENVELKPLRIDSEGGVMSDSDPERADEPSSGLYVHGLVLEVRGDYLSTLRYLESLESLGWRLLWDEIDYSVIEYPEARVRITLHSLSRREGWIGV